MKNSHQIQEEIDELRYEAKGIYAAAESAGRELTDEESKRFDEITDKKTGLIAVLAQQKSEAEDRERKIAEMQVRERRQRSLEEIDGSLLDEPETKPRVVLTTAHSRRTTDEPRVYVRAARLKAFKSERDAYDCGMWMRAIISRLYNRGDDKQAAIHCQRMGLDISNAAYEGSGTAGGYMVPPQFAQTIIDVREMTGIARRVCDIQPMTSDTLTIPKRSGGLTVYYPNELQTITDSDKSWQQIQLVAKKRAVASKISQELVDDALISIVDNVVSEMGYALALQEDNELCNGTGSSSYGGVQGLVSKIGSAGVYTTGSSDNLWSEIDLGDVMATMAKLPDRFNRSPAWICSSNFFWAVFARLMAAAGGSSIRDIEAGTGATKQFMGVPVYTTSVMPTVDADSTIHALFGQFDMAVVLGDRIGIRIGRDDSTGFLADYTTLKATARTDMFVHEPGDSSNPGAYVALKTNAA